ncbi:MAG: hypothetical protein KA248_12740 [Kiritimatiellae bacterium]|nr:hypothetical protein [Kiritimatiellia bacterium]
MKPLAVAWSFLFIGSAFLVPAPVHALSVPDFSGVAYLEAYLFDAADNALLAGYGPFEWADGMWLIDRVPLGRELVLQLVASDEQGRPLFEGEMEGIWLDPDGDFMGIGMGVIIMMRGAEGIRVIADPYADFGEMLLEPVPAALTVGVDIKPGSERNPVNLRAHGVLVTAVLGAEDFDVSRIDLSTLTLAGLPVERTSKEDVSGPGGKRDGMADLVTFVRIPALAAVLADLPRGDVVKLVLAGALEDGTLIEGGDTVQILKPKK